MHSEQDAPRETPMVIATDAQFRSAAERVSIGAPLIQMITGARVTQAIYVAAKLGIADLLVAGPRSPNDLARSCGAYAPFLCRLLRALASLGIFAEDADGRFGLTSLAQSLRSDVPGSLRAAALFNGDPWWWQVNGDLLHTIRSGEPAPHHLRGLDMWGYLTQHPEDAAVFNDAMTAQSEREIPAILAAYDFAEIGCLVDIAGGHGALIAAILRSYLAMRGILFDLPEVVAGARFYLEASGVSERCELIGGDMFVAVPQGAGAYIEKYILHDWPDERASLILTTIHRAMPVVAKLLLIEHVIEPGNGPQAGKLLDVTPLMHFGGRERTAAEWHALLSAAGFTIARFLPTQAGVSIIEALKL